MARRPDYDARRTAKTLAKIERLLEDSKRAALFQFRFTIGFAVIGAALAISLALASSRDDISLVLAVTGLLFGGLGIILAAMVSHWRISRRRREYRRKIVRWAGGLLAVGAFLLAASALLSLIDACFVPYVRAGLAVFGLAATYVSGYLVNRMIGEMHGGRGRADRLPL